MTSSGSRMNIPPVMNFFPGVTLLFGVTSATAPVILVRKSLTFAGKIWKVHIMLNKSPQENF
jgi:hypothetical protein